MYGDNTTRIGIALALAFAALVGLTLVDLAPGRRSDTSSQPLQTSSPQVAMVQSVSYSNPASVLPQISSGVGSWASASLGPAASTPPPAPASQNVVRPTGDAQLDYSAQIFLPPLTVYTMTPSSPLLRPTAAADLRYADVNTAVSQPDTSSSQNRWIRLPGKTPLWLTDIHLDSGGFIHNNMPVAGVLSGVRGLWLLNATIYNSSTQGVQIVPCRLAFEDGSSEPVFTSSGAWVSSVDPSASFSGGYPAGGFCSPALSNTLAVDLPPHSLTTIRMFAGNEGAVENESPTSASGLRLAVARTPVLRPRYPRAIQFIETGPDDTRYQLASDGTVVDQFKQAVTLLQTAEKDQAQPLHEIPATIETLSRFGQVYPGGVPR